ncbi:MAG TPA: M24 family metallopeptidase [bacterium]|nr:M24 family metallopeptidase [bacterium]
MGSPDLKRINPKILEISLTRLPLRDLVSSERYGAPAPPELLVERDAAFPLPALRTTMTGLCRNTQFVERPIPAEYLFEVLRAARWAPSAGNFQPIRYVTLRDRAHLARLQDLAEESVRISGHWFPEYKQSRGEHPEWSGVPAAIALIADPSKGGPHIHGEATHMLAGGLAAQNMWLMAEALMQEARKIKTQDEITLTTTAVMMVDAAYEELFRALRPGMRENECVGLVSKVLYDLGSEHVGDPAYFDILHSYNGYRTCYYRTFCVGSASPAMVDAYKRCRDYLDSALSLIRPGVTTADVVRVWPKAKEFGFANEEAAFALQYGHGVGLSIWEKPIFSRLVSLDHPEVIEEGMVFALETFWPASDGWSAARIEEQLVVTKDGCEVITRFPAEQLLVAGTRYWTVDGPLPTTRETQSNLNRPSGTPKDRVAAGARHEGSGAGGRR